MQGARRGFINGKQDVKATEKHSVECIVLLTLWFIILSCLGCCNKRPSHNILFNIYWSRNQSAAIRVPHPSADSAVCVQAQNRKCSKINLCICTPVYKFNIDELLLWHTSCICPFRRLTRVRDSPVVARAVHTEQNTTRMYWKDLSFAPKCILIAYIFEQTRLKNACKWYNLVTTCSGPI